MLLTFVIIFLASCKDDETPTPTSTINVSGLTYGNSNQSFSEANTLLIDALNAVEPIKIVAEVVHSDNATSVGETLNLTKVILFGNPNLGTPLMQQNQLAGLDLPQKLLLFVDDDEQLRVAYNDVSYLSKRHDVANVETINSISGALANFANMVSNEDLEISENSDVQAGEGIVIKNSQNSFDETYSKLIEVIDANENLRIIKELDHSANAATVNLALLPTKLIIFGNPNLGTPLMQKAQTIGIDLPQKFLVYEDANGSVNVAYNDPNFLATRHKITDNEDILTTITNALNNLSNAATM